MDFQDKKTIFNRSNDAAYDLSLAKTAQRNGNNELFVKHKRDAGEAISQSLEYALKHYLDKNLLPAEKQNYNVAGQNLGGLIGKFTDEKGKDNGYLYKTINNKIKPSVVV